MDDLPTDDCAALLRRNRPRLAGAALADLVIFAVLAFLATRGQADNVVHALLLRLALVALPLAALLPATLLPPAWKAALAMNQAIPSPPPEGSRPAPEIRGRKRLWRDLAVLSLGAFGVAVPTLLMLAASGAVIGAAVGVFALQYGVSVAMARRLAGGQGGTA